MPQRIEARLVILHPNIEELGLHVAEGISSAVTSFRHGHDLGGTVAFAIALHRERICLSHAAEVARWRAATSWPIDLIDAAADHRLIDLACKLVINSIVACRMAAVE